MDKWLKCASSCREHVGWVWAGLASSRNGGNGCLGPGNRETRSARLGQPGLDYDKCCYAVDIAAISGRSGICDNVRYPAIGRFCGFAVGLWASTLGQATTGRPAPAPGGPAQAMPHRRPPAGDRPAAGAQAQGQASRGMGGARRASAARYRPVAERQTPPRSSASAQPWHPHEQLSGVGALPWLSLVNAAWAVALFSGTTQN